MKHFIGYDIGSSSVKATLIEADSGKAIASDYFPKQEMNIIARKHGWAEQDPEDWWTNLKSANKSLLKISGVKSEQIKAIGITWQMHGLVLVDKDQKLLRPSIIWCDSRAVPYGENAFRAIGEQRCLSHLLNSPGNFTASKLAWVKNNEPEIYDKIDKLMLPGDYIAMKLSGEIGITIEGLSEGIFWDFKNKQLSEDIIHHYGIPKSFFPNIRPIFGHQASVSESAANELGLQKGTPITYRAGDQPNNAMSLNIFNKGEIAATAGTSGVVYGVLDRLYYDTKSRVNTFAHVNYTEEQTNLGILLCINGTGILNSWLKRNLGLESISYAKMNTLASQSSIGAKGISIVPFGNGAERVLENRETDCSIHGINFNIHDKRDLLRAAQEGISFSFHYGMDIMRDMGMDINLIRSGYTNMFLSPIFSQTLSSISGATIELFNTDGAAGAARAAGIGLGYYADHNEAFASLEKLKTIEPQLELKAEYQTAYEKWKSLI